MEVLGLLVLILFVLVFVGLLVVLDVHHRRIRAQRVCRHGTVCEHRVVVLRPEIAAILFLKNPLDRSWKGPTKAPTVAVVSVAGVVSCVVDLSELTEIGIPGIILVSLRNIRSLKTT